MQTSSKPATIQPTSSVSNCSATRRSVAFALFADAFPEVLLSTITVSPGTFGTTGTPRAIGGIIRHARFWDADRSRKWAVFTFSSPSHNRIHITKYFFPTWETNSFPLSTRNVHFRLLSASQKRGCLSPLIFWGHILCPAANHLKVRSLDREVQCPNKNIGSCNKHIALCTASSIYRVSKLHGKTRMLHVKRRNLKAK